MNRASNIARLKSEPFDICIIGAGASGAGCALDAALRGLKVALIDKTDFAAETSSRSTKLIHGGVRYLEQAFKNLDFAQLRQVRHGLEERHAVLANAPHLARPLALVTPVFSWLEGLYFSIGLKMYGWFASRHDTLPASRWLSKAETLRRMPNLSPRMHSAVLYYDGQHDDARYCVALAQSAFEAGAAVANHVQVFGFQHDKNGALTSANVLDSVSGERFSIAAKVFVNCTGPYADAIRLAANPDLSPRIRPSKGVHVVLPAEVLFGSLADDGDAPAVGMLIPKTPDGRVVFAIPYEGQLMLGTTDTDYRMLEKEPVLESQEVDFLLDTLAPYLARKVERSALKAGFGGLRPLIAAPEKSETKRLVRDHEVEKDARSGLISLLGGKWTTYRLMAQDAVDAACRALNNTAPCRTLTHKLAGGENYQPDDWKKLVADFGFPADVARHLLHKYGSRAFRVAEIARQRPDLALRLDAKFPYIRAEIVHAAQAEMACTVRDFMARRIRLEIADWQTAMDVAPIVAFHLGETLGWSETKTREAAEEYRALVEGFLKKANSLLNT